MTTPNTLPVISRECRDDDHLQCFYTNDNGKSLMNRCDCPCHTPYTLEWHRCCLQYDYHALNKASDKPCRNYWQRKIRTEEKAIEQMERAAITKRKEHETETNT